MAYTINIKKYIDLPESRPLNPFDYLYAGSISGTKSYAPLNNIYPLLFDNRNSKHRDPHVYYGFHKNRFFQYNPVTDGWKNCSNYTQNFNILYNSSSITHGANGVTGVIGAGSTTTKLVLSSTSIPSGTGYAQGQLGNKGDGSGWYVRVIGSATGSSGKSEIVEIETNTEGLTPTIYLKTALTFTPIANDTVEILTSVCYWNYNSTFYKYDPLLNLAETKASLPSYYGYSGYMVALDESNVPVDKESHVDGYLGEITATGSSATTLTGAVTGGDSGVLANEYRNFQIRIVEDTVNTTAVGQRRRITSHTAGASPVYTVPAWSVTPSSSAKYVLENDNDKILYYNGSTKYLYCYNISTNTWDSTTFAQNTGSTSFQAYGSWFKSSFFISTAKQNLVKPSQFTLSRGYSGYEMKLDIFDISAGANGVWTNDIVNGMRFYSYSYSTEVQDCKAVHNPFTQDGKYLYFYNSKNSMLSRYNILTRSLEPFMFAEPSQLHDNYYSGQTMLAMFLAQDGASKVASLMYPLQDTSTFNAVFLFDEI